jgi:hypothetical protein
LCVIKDGQAVVPGCVKERKGRKVRKKISITTTVEQEKQGTVRVVAVRQDGAFLLQKARGTDVLTVFSLPVVESFAIADLEEWASRHGLFHIQKGCLCQVSGGGDEVDGAYLVLCHQVVRGIRPDQVWGKPEDRLKGVRLLPITDLVEFAQKQNMHQGA